MPRHTFRSFPDRVIFRISSSGWARKVLHLTDGQSYTVIRANADPYGIVRWFALLDDSGQERKYSSRFFIPDNTPVAPPPAAA